MGRVEDTPLPPIVIDSFSFTSPDGIRRRYLLATPEREAADELMKAAEEFLVLQRDRNCVASDLNAAIARLFAVVLNAQRSPS